MRPNLGYIVFILTSDANQIDRIKSLLLVLYLVCILIVVI